MSKFWVVVALIFSIAVSLNLGGQSPKIEVENLGSSCSYRYTGFQDVSLEDSSLRFEGAFLGGTSTNPGYEYTIRKGRIDLHVKSASSSTNQTCRKMVKYDLRTSPLREGEYRVRVFHDERKVYDSVLDIG